MIITLYTIEKRKNSTKLPGAGVDIVGQLRNNSTVENPTIDFSMPNPVKYNYARIPEFGRYYWVSWSYANGLWIASMTVDPLSSYREQIGSSSQYVVRSSAERDGDIIDTFYPAKAASKTLHAEPYKQPWYGSVETSFVIGIIGNGESGNGAVTYYSFSELEFGLFADMLLGNSDYLGSDFGADITLDYLKTQINPFQYIVSCIRYPWETSGTPVGEIRLGWWKIKTPARLLDRDRTNRAVFTLDIPKHPQAAARGNYLNSAPFSRYNLFIPCFGQLPIPAAQLAGHPTLYIYVDTDLATGRGILFGGVTGGNHNTIFKMPGFVGAPVQLAQIAQNTAGFAASAIGAVAAAASLNFIGAASGVANAINSAIPQMQTSGTNGSYSEFERPAELVCEFFPVVDDDNEDHGKPLCKVREIARIPGYIMCEHADVSIAGTESENQMIKDYMEGGFFYE